MGKLISPFTDYKFKLIFGGEVSRDLLIEFPNDLLEGERVVTDLTFLNSERLPDCPEGRGIIYDVYYTTDTDEKIIVEIQNHMQSNFKECSIFYLFRAIVNQGRTGHDWKFEIKAVYRVFLINFIVDRNIKLRTDVILADKETGELFSEKFRQIPVALPLFKKNEEEYEANFERWIYILNNMEALKRLPFKARKAVSEKLEEIASMASMSPKERELYDNSVEVCQDYLVTMDAMEKEGIRKGMKKGMKEGLKKGLEGSLKKDREEALNIFQTAIDMKKQGIDNRPVAEKTGLPLLLIKSLKQRQNLNIRPPEGKPSTYPKKVTEIEREKERVAIIVSEPRSQVVESNTYALICNKIGRKGRKKRSYKISISLRRTWYIRDCKLTINIRDSTKSSTIHQYRSTYNRQAIFLGGYHTGNSERLRYHRTYTHKKEGHKEHQFSFHRFSLKFNL